MSPPGRAQGALRTLIQWDGPHPTDMMPEAGVGLRAVALRGLEPCVRELPSIRGAVSLDSPGPALRATLATPRGVVVLESR